ncbi:GNAT family N-acetyltransferase [Primorskyibacter flagellatus]|uniref:GNAT family N-acetyltransferase n=1 Tax=Primorskyibacter flagellatus TaxID=1387277 RepID=UPI003A94619B
MKTLHLAGPDDLPRLLPLVAAFHTHQAFDTDTDHQTAAILPLLEGSPHGAIWLIGPRKAPVGYVVVTFGWSVEYGGLDGIVDELYIRPAVRGRGMGFEAVNSLAHALRDNGVRALHLEADRSDETLSRFYRRSGFRPREGYLFMSRVL